MQWLGEFLSSDSFLPHGYCLLWRQDLVALHLGSDALIALAYYSIPISLFYFVRRRRDLEFKWVFLFFAAFIFACGTTHLFGVVTLWQPAYGVEGVVKAFTALISVATALAVWPLLPKALALPSPSQLAAVNLELRTAQQALAQNNQQLERRVEERTAELLGVNDRLRAEIAERQRAEEQNYMLMAELEHRVKNALAVAQSLVVHTRASSGTIDEFTEAFGGRLRAMGKAQDLLIRGNWRGAELAELLRAAVGPSLPRPEALVLDGPAAQLPPALASSLSMILHELATNAAKYGAWSREGGRVEARWSEADGGIAFEWREVDGPPVERPTRRGFGARMIEHNAGYELGGGARLEFLPEGLLCRIDIKLA